MADKVRIVNGKYNTTDGIALDYDVFYPEDSSEAMPAVVLFFGGGWRVGEREKFHPQASVFAQKGYVVFTPDYRIYTRQSVSPRECVDDAVHFWQYLRENAASLKIDTERIALGGGSAGAHIAMMAALRTGVYPKVFVLYNPAVHLKGLLFYLKIIRPYRAGYPAPKDGLNYRNFDDISPKKHLGNYFPPSIFLHGKRDMLVPIFYVKSFIKSLKKIGTITELHAYKGASHGFFNKSKGEVYFNDTNQKVLDFLAKYL